MRSFTPFITVGFRYSLLLVLWLVCLCASSVNRWTIEGDAFFGNIIKHDAVLRALMLTGNMSGYTLKAGYNTTPADSSYFASDYNYPILGVGFTVNDFSRVELTRHSRLATNYVLYAFMERSLWRYKGLSVSYQLDAGLAYAPYPFDPYTNPSNEFVSWPIMVYLGAGVSLKYNFLRNWEIGALVGMKHYSNGRMAMPNKGMNIYGASLSLRYYFTPPPARYQRLPRRPITPKLYTVVSLSGGLQASLEEWELYCREEERGYRHFRRYPKFSAAAALMYRYARRYGTGIGVDIFYTPHVQNHRLWDMELYGPESVEGVKYYPLSVGISLNQEVYYRQFAVYIAIGYYLTHELGLREKISPFYQRLGVRYYIKGLNDLFVGYGIKAHSFRLAENMELSLGMKF